MRIVNFQMFKLDLEKAEEPEINCQHLLDQWKSKRVPEKHILLLYWLLQSLSLCGSQQTVEVLQEKGIPDHVTCLLSNLCACQEVTVSIGHGKTDWFQIMKRVCQGCILSPSFFNLCAEYIMWNAELDEAQAGIRIPRTNINKLSYTHDTTLMAESELEPKSLLMKVKEESEKVGLKLTLRKLTSWHPPPSLHGK